jgi:hypothetical protein
MIPPSKLLLWDGNQYDLEALRAYPELVSYSTDHPVLCEAVPFRAQRIDEGKRFWYGLLLALPFAALLIFDVAMQKGLGAALLMGVSVAFVPFLIFLSRRAGTYLWSDRIEIRNGRVSLHYGDAMFAIKVPLSQCSWYLGPASDGDRTRRGLQEQRIIMVLPRRGLLRKQVRFACGWTDVMQAILSDFLTVAQVPRNR